MKSEELDKIIAEAPEQVTLVLGELHAHILEAAAEALAAAQDQEDGGKPKVKVGLSLTIELNKAPVAWLIQGSVGITYKVAGNEMVADTEPELSPGLGKSLKSLKKTLKDAGAEMTFGKVTVRTGKGDA